MASTAPPRSASARPVRRAHTCPCLDATARRNGQQHRHPRLTGEDTEAARRSEQPMRGARRVHREEARPGSPWLPRSPSICPPHAHRTCATDGRGCPGRAGFPEPHALEASCGLISCRPMTHRPRPALPTIRSHQRLLCTGLRGTSAKPRKRLGHSHGFPGFPYKSIV